jgi:hypothetical protein
MLNAALAQIATEVIKSVSADMLNQLKQQIMLDTYSHIPRNRYYYNKTGKPTFEFLHAWDWTAINSTISEITRTLFYDYTKMHFDAKTYLHGDEFHGDLREKLAELLNVEGWDEENAFGGAQRHPYWTDYIDKMFSSAEGGEINNLFEKYLAKYQFV